MLNIYFYENVPFQSDYENIIQFANKNALINYLSSYKALIGIWYRSIGINSFVK